MARIADPHRRAELLDQIVDYLAGHGLSTLSMRPLARLIHEIEGLAAAGKLKGHMPRLLADRSEFLAGLLRERGMPEADALRISTLSNSAYTGLQIDFLTTGDRERVEAALAQLCALVDDWVTSASTSPERRPPST
jgi:hypothetical protein